MWRLNFFQQKTCTNCTGIVILPDPDTDGGQTQEIGNCSKGDWKTRFVCHLSETQVTVHGPHLKLWTEWFISLRILALNPSCDNSDSLQRELRPLKRQTLFSRASWPQHYGLTLTRTTIRTVSFVFEWLIVIFYKVWTPHKEQFLSGSMYFSWLHGHADVRAGRPAALRHQGLRRDVPGERMFRTKLENWLLFSWEHSPE